MLAESATRWATPSVSIIWVSASSPDSCRRRVKPITLHWLRHTSASLLLSAGVPPHVVQQRLGHKRVEITLDLYTRPAGAATRRRAASRLARLGSLTPVSRNLVDKWWTGALKLTELQGVFRCGAEGGSLRSPVRPVFSRATLSGFSPKIAPFATSSCCLVSGSAERFVGKWWSSQALLIPEDVDV